MREKPAFLENGFQGGEEHVDWGCLGVGRGPHRHFLLFSMCCRRSGFVCCAPGRRHPRVPVAREDRERRQSWCCRGRRRGVGVGGEEPVPSSSRAVGLGGACSPAGVGQFAERPHAAGLSVLARGWDSWSGRCSHCTDGRERPWGLVGGLGSEQVAGEQITNIRVGKEQGSSSCRVWAKPSFGAPSLGMITE